MLDKGEERFHGVIVMTENTSNKIAPDAGPLGLPGRAVITPVDGAFYLEEIMKKEKCSVLGCERLRKGKKNYCHAHSLQFKRYGKIISTELQHTNKNKKCTAPGCTRDAFCKSLCKAHDEQIRNHGRILVTALKESRKGKVCKLQGCATYPVKGLGLCERHYEQFKKYGEIISIDRMYAEKIGNGMRQSGGYIYLYRPDHPRAIREGWVKRANIVWEENTGHVVSKPEIIHHKNEIRDDDSVGNLDLCKNNSEHFRIHVLKRRSEAMRCSE